MGIRRGIIFSLFFASIAGAAVIPENASYEVISDFSGGLNTTVTRNKVPKNMSPYMRNVLIDEKIGSVTAFPGFITAGSTTTLIDVRSGFVFNKENGDKEYLISDSTIVLSTKDFKTYTLVRDKLTRSTNLQYAQIRNKVWMTNGVDAVFTWDGTSMTILDGTNSTPNVPRDKYIALYQERAFLFGNQSDNSALDFSALTVSTSGTIIAPDNVLAWPATNRLEVGQGDGQSATFLKVFRGILQIGKDNSIYSLQGSDITNYFPRKSQSKVGFVSADSIIELDNRLYGQAKDGFYAFDGADSERITDAIIPDIQGIRTDTSRIVSNIWETQSDFARNNQLGGATITASGLLTVFATNYINQVNFAFAVPPTNEIFFTGTSTSTNFLPLPSGSVDVNNKYVGAISQIGIFGGNSSSTNDGKIRIRKKSTGAFIEVNANMAFDGSNNTKITQIPTTFYFNINDVVSQDIEMRIEVSTGSFFVGESIGISSPTVLGHADILFSNSSGSYVSEITTAPTTITSWTHLDSVNNTNGGIIGYYYKAATSPVNIATYPWISITPGALINSSSTSNYIQWTSSLTGQLANIDNVTIGHIEGNGANTRSFGAEWKNRWWIGVSTEITGNFPVFYLKSRGTNSNPNAWMPAEGINVRCLIKDGEDNLYAGSSTAPIVYRLDFGTNFDGKAIVQTYDTPALNLSHGKFPGLSGFFEKKLYQYLIDADQQSNATLSIGTSINGGAFAYNSISLNGSGRLLTAVNSVNAGGTNDGKNFSFRFRLTDLDKSMNIHSFGVLYTPTDIR